MKGNGTVIISDIPAPGGITIPFQLTNKILASAMSYKFSTSQRESRQGFGHEESSPVNTENDTVSRNFFGIKPYRSEGKMYLTYITKFN